MTILWPILLALPLAEGDSGFEYPVQRVGEVSATLGVEVVGVNEEKTGPVVALTTRIEGPMSLEVEQARLDPDGPEWRLLRSSAWLTQDNRIVVSERLLLSQAVSRSVPLPSVRVRFRTSPGGAWREAEWTDILASPKDIVPAEVDVVSHPTPSALFWWGASAVVVALILLGLGVWWMSRAVPPDPLTPEEEAILGLDRLASDSTMDQREFATGLSLVVRRFLAHRFGIAALETTTDELLEQLGCLEGLDSTLVEPVELLARRTDLAKFAPTEIGEEQRSHLLELARGFVEQVSQNAEEQRPWR